MYDVLEEQRCKVVPREVFQFFSSTCDRKDLVVNTYMHENPALGPGTYDFEKRGKSTRHHTDAFRQSLRPDNVFGRVPDFPGPTDYHLPGDASTAMNDTFAQK